MTRLAVLGYLLSAFATASAWALARRRTEHRPVAWLLTCGLVTDLVRVAIQLGILAPGYALLGGAPATGWLRLAFHIEQALFVAWPAALAAAAIALFLRRRPWPAVLAWAAMAGVLAAGYPTIRGALLQRAYLGAKLAGITVGFGALLTWALPRTRKLELSHACLALVIILDAGTLVVGAWRTDVFTAWPLDQIGYCVLYAVLIAMQGGGLWTLPSVSTSD